jgi:hypothetical protein
MIESTATANLLSTGAAMTLTGITQPFAVFVSIAVAFCGAVDVLFD